MTRAEQKSAEADVKPADFAVVERQCTDARSASVAARVTARRKANDSACASEFWQHVHVRYLQQALKQSPSSLSQRRLRGVACLASLAWRRLLTTSRAAGPLELHPTHVVVLRTLAAQCAVVADIAGAPSSPLGASPADQHRTGSASLFVPWSLVCREK